MTRMKKISILFMAGALMCLAMLLGGCGASGTATYTVSVKDAFGNAYPSGIIVQFMQDGEQVAMQACDESGVAVKELEKGDYTVELKFTDSADNYYYESGCVLSAKETEGEVTLACKISSAEPTLLYVEGNEYDAYSVSEGCTYVDLNAGERSYFLFTPGQAGTYEFSVIGETNTEIGYYGAPHFVQSVSAAEVVDGKFTISVSTSMIGTEGGGTSIFVLGVDSLDADTKNCVLGINRLGDAEKTIEDEPWEIYEKTVELDFYDLPEGYEIQEFDLTASTDTYNLVFNEEDGYYHLDSADGPLVLARLGEDCDYIACFQTMLERSGVVKYFYDEDGEFVKRESYSECLLEYIQYVDEYEGVYPLTEDLKYIIQQRGDHAGWWNIEDPGYIFKDADGNNLTDINSEIAWLLMCCYIE